MKAPTPGSINKLDFKEVNSRRFPSTKLIDKCLNRGFLAPTIVNACNEVSVDLFLNNHINFNDIVKNIKNIFYDKDFKKYARKRPKTIKDIKIADQWARLKTLSMCVR